MTWLTSLINLSIRAFSLAARFLLSIFMVKYLLLEEIGVFGLLVSITAGAPAILGFGLNYFVNREIVAMPLSQAIAHLRDRLVVTLICSLIVAAIFVFSVHFIVSLPSIPSLWLLLPVFVLETLAIDLHFGLISIKKSVLANLLLFFRSAIWVYPFMLFAWMSPELRNLSWLLTFWLSGQLFMLLFLYISSADWGFRELFKISPNYGWILAFLKRSKLIYVSDLAIFLSMFFDRFFLSGMLGLADLGVFVFCATIAGSVYLLVSAAFVQNLVPSLVELVNKKDMPELSRAFYLQLRNAVLVAVALGLIILLAYGYLVDALGRPELSNYKLLLLTLMISCVLKLCADAYNQLMYALHLDRKWSFINILAMMFVLLFISILTPIFGMTGAAIASSLAWLLIIFIRRHTCIKEMQSMMLGAVP